MTEKLKPQKHTKPNGTAIDCPFRCSFNSEYYERNKNNLLQSVSESKIIQEEPTYASVSSYEWIVQFNIVNTCVCVSED